MYKTRQPQTAFGSWDVEKVHAVWREAHFEVKSAKNWGGWDTFGRAKCRFSWQAQGIVHLSKSSKKREGFCSSFIYNHHFTTLHTPLHYTLHYNNNYNYITLHYTACITLQYATLYWLQQQQQQQQQQQHYTTLHCTALHCTALHYTHYTTLHFTSLHAITLYYTTLITLHYATLIYTTLQRRLQLQLHCTTLH